MAAAATKCNPVLVPPLLPLVLLCSLGDPGRVMPLVLLCSLSPDHRGVVPLGCQWLA
jgi:hypothetical protein